MEASIPKLPSPFLSPVLITITGLGYEAFNLPNSKGHRGGEVPQLVTQEARRILQVMSVANGLLLHHLKS